MKNLLILLIGLIISQGCGIFKKTSKESGSNSVVKNDSIGSLAKDSSFSLVEKREVKPDFDIAVVSDIAVDTFGRLVPFTISVKSPITTDSMVIQLSGNKLKANCHCTGCEILLRDTQIKLSESKKTIERLLENKNSFINETKSPDKPVFSWYVWYVLGFLTPIILYLIIRK
jgi:hypothetical protein